MPRKETTKTFMVTPMGAVRQTKADAWKKRPVVMRYRAYRDELRRLLDGWTLPESGYHVTFYMPMPKSWSKKKRAAMEGQPHQSKPDKDNLEKALLDVMFDEDSHVWDGRTTKRWSEIPRIEIEVEQYKEQS